MMRDIIKLIIIIDVCMYVTCIIKMKGIRAYGLDCSINNEYWKLMKFHCFCTVYEIAKTNMIICPCDFINIEKKRKTKIALNVCCFM